MQGVVSTVTVDAHCDNQQMIQGVERIKQLHTLADNMPLDPGQRQALKGIMASYPTVFAMDLDPFTTSEKFSHTIRLSNEDVVYQRPYPVPQKYHSAVRSQISEMLRSNIIEPSISAYM